MVYLNFVIPQRVPSLVPARQPPALVILEGINSN